MRVRIPKYRLHKASGQALVEINGRRIYLGKHATDASHERYHRLVAEWLSEPRDRSLIEAPGETPTLTVNRLILRYWQFAEGYYTRDGKQSTELGCLREALLPLRELYGRTPAAVFGPKALKAVRQQMVDRGLSRGVINRDVGRIKRVFKWAVAEELVPPSLYHALQAVSGLRFGRTEARETEPVKPVPDLHVALVLPFVSPQVADMIWLQRVTGMRAGEIVIMRPDDIDNTGDVWTYEPYDHKNRWRGHSKSIALGPEAQRILAPYMDRPADRYLFAPAEAEAWRVVHRPPYHGRPRKTKVYPSELRRREKIKEQRRRSRRHRSRSPGDRYDTNSYRRAIERGIAKAAKNGVIIPHWHPHQLRHSRATEIRRQFGIEAAQVVLGHAKADVTQVYAERDLELAQRVAKRTG
ncbi:MAG: site-specific integrase [SAR202 cluster bacterium]|nr:site-specific integrase [SAR202 cluster bacterium]